MKRNNYPRYSMRFEEDEYDKEHEVYRDRSWWLVWRMDYLLYKWTIEEGLDFAPEWGGGSGGSMMQGGMGVAPSNCTTEIREMYVKKISQIWDELENV